MNAPWLFAEAYKYRRLRECFSLSKYWVDYGKLVWPGLFDGVGVKADQSRCLLQAEVRYLLQVQSGRFRALHPILSASRDREEPLGRGANDQDKIALPRAYPGCVQLH